MIVIPGSVMSLVHAKEKARAADPNDPTSRLFQLLDTGYSGKLVDFYLLGDIYKDPKNSNDELQRVLRVDYDKNRGFGKLKLYVRSVAKMQPEQLKAYTPKMVYEYGVADTEKFVKTERGPLGKTGDLYLRATDDRPLSSTPISEEAEQEYERLLTDYVLPALQKK
jgi:hypothetical protein